LTGLRFPFMMMKLTVGSGARREPGQQAARCHVSRLLPPRSMVGQPPLERHIGVRIPGGQPSILLQSQSTSTDPDASLRFIESYLLQSAGLPHFHRRTFLSVRHVEMRGDARTFFYKRTFTVCIFRGKVGTYIQARVCMPLGRKNVHTRLARGAPGAANVPPREKTQFMCVRVCS
jgi:hypothetical protein